MSRGVIFDIEPSSSKMSFRASSNVHPIIGGASGINGSLEVSLEEGKPDLGSPIKGAITMHVADLRTGNLAYDTEIKRRIGIGTHPEIKGVLTGVKKLHDGYRVFGDLSFHGQTRSVAVDMDVWVDANRLRASWDQKVDIRDFDLKPPRVLMLKVDPEVEVSVELVGKARER